MPISINSLIKASKLLSESGYDVAAGLSEASLNDFLDAHWKSENSTLSSVYKGTGRADEVGLSWSYEVQQPGTIDLQPIKPDTFARVYKNWLRTVPELDRFVSAQRQKGSEPYERGDFLDIAPPNVQVQLPKLHVEVKTDSGIKVDFDYALTITGFIETDLVAGKRVIRITPVSAKVTDPNYITDRLASVLPKAMSSSTDCVELQKLILYLINVLIANRIGSFVRQFSLPVPIDVVNGVVISDVELDISDDLLVMIGRLKPSPGPQMTLSAYAGADDHELFINAAKGRDEVTFANPNDVIPITGVNALAAQAWPMRGIFVILHERLFQAIASTVVVNESQSFTKYILGIKGKYGYSLRVWGLVAQVVDDGLVAQAQFSGSGWARACIDTHCGDKCVGIALNPRANPRLSSEFSIVGRELWMTAKPGLFNITWDPEGLPWPFNKILGWVLEGVSAAALLIAKLIGLQWKTKLLSFPEVFPGTSLGFDPKLDKRIIKDPSQSALMIVGEVDFQP